MRGAGGGPPRQPRVPTTPLITALVNRGLVDSSAAATDIARKVGLSRQTIREAVRCGELTIWAADHAAVNGLNAHPTELWGDAWLDHVALNDPNVDRSARIDDAFASLREAL